MDLTVFCIKIRSEPSRILKQNWIIGVHSSCRSSQFCVEARHSLHFSKREAGTRQSRRDAHFGSAAHPSRGRPRLRADLQELGQAGPAPEPPSALRSIICTGWAAAQKVCQATSSARLKVHSRLQHAVVLRTVSIHKLIFHHEFIPD